MTRVRALVIAREGQTTQIKSIRSCTSCQTCGVEKFQSATISGSYHGEVVLEIELRDQCFALFNSLLLPLLFALGFAFVADMLLTNELIGIISAVCGFSIGMLVCQQLKPTALSAKQID